MSSISALVYLNILVYRESKLSKRYSGMNANIEKIFCENFFMSLNYYGQCSPFYRSALMLSGMLLMIRIMIMQWKHLGVQAKRMGLFR